MTQDPSAEVSTLTPVESFEDYAREHARVLYLHALIRVLRREEAEDRVQEAFLRIWKVWPERHERIRASGIAYAMRTLNNCIIDHARHTARRPHEVLLEDPRGVAGAHLFGELQRELWAAVAILDETLQQLIELVYVQGYSVLGASRILGLAPRTAANYHKRALLELRRIIEGDYREDHDGGR